MITTLTLPECIMSCAMNKECGYVQVALPSCRLHTIDMTKIQHADNDFQIWYQFQRTGTTTINMYYYNE